MKPTRLSEVTSEQWDALIDDEPSPWGDDKAERLEWVRKQRYVAILGEAGMPIALAGALVAEVSAGEERFPVVGIGSVIVTRARRGEGLARIVIDEILQVARELGPPRAMLFCLNELTGLYARFGFRELPGDVTADQPGGRIVVPMRAMWAPLAPGATWPAGEVAVLGGPF